jgi:hypothetical protein
MQRRTSLLHAGSIVLFGTTAVACAPLTWHETATASVSARTITEEPPRLDPARDVLDVSVDTKGDHALVRVSRVVACTSEAHERVTVEKVRRGEPDPTFIVLDHVALIGGAIVASAGVGLAVGCIGKSGGSCDAVVPLIGGGLVTEVLGLTALAIDSGKRTTERIPHEEVRSFGFVTRECARTPVGGVEVSLVPDAGPAASARTDDAGNADIPLGAQGPLDVDVRLDGRSVRRMRLR